MSNSSAASLPTDDVLVALLRKGDEATFELLLEAWQGSMLWVASTFVSTHDSAFEVIQETWISVLTGIEGFEGRSALKTWVFRILVNVAKRQGAREGRTIPWSSWAEADDQSLAVSAHHFREDDLYADDRRLYPRPWPTPTPEDAVLAAEVQVRLGDALSRLPGRQRVVITLRDVLGHDSDEVCAILGISAANQRVLLHRARAQLRARLEDYYHFIRSDTPERPPERVEGRASPR